MQSLSRALTVLEELARQDSPRTLTQLTDAVGLHKSTVHRMLATFVRHGVVRRDESNRYEIGGLLGLSRQGAATTDPWAALDRIGGRLALLSGAHVAYVVPREHGLERSISYAPDGSRFVLSHSLPWHASAAAKAYLALRPRTEVQRIIGRSPLEAFTTYTMTDPFLLMQALNRARTRGYAVEDREQDLRVRALGAAVTDRHGAATAALELQVPAETCDPAALQSLAGHLCAAARELSEQLAGQEHRQPLSDLTKVRA